MNTLDPDLGGRPGNTVALRNQYGLYNRQAQIEGQAPMKWEDWVKIQGFTIGPDGHVIRMTNPKALPAGAGLLGDMNTAQIPIQQLMGLLG